MVHGARAPWNPRKQPSVPPSDSVDTLGGRGLHCPESRFRSNPIRAPSGDAYAKEIITEKMRAAIGVKSKPVSYPVERWHVQRFAEAIDDDNPLYRDAEFAKKHGYADVVVSPTFLRCMIPEALPMDPRAESGLDRVLDGGSEWEYFEPVHPGDTITVTAEFLDMNVKSGRMGDMYVGRVITTYSNGAGKTVATQTSTRILY